jgi:hypothetical protein
MQGLFISSKQERLSQGPRRVSAMIRPVKLDFGTLDFGWERRGESRGGWSGLDKGLELDSDKETTSWKYMVYGSRKKCFCNDDVQG